MTKTLLPLAGLEEVLRYEPETGKLFWLVRRSTKASAAIGSLSFRSGYIDFGYKGKTYKAHRVAWYLHTGKDPGSFYIDHINGRRDDNRISNLRLCTHAQNRCNSKTRVGNTSGYKGVYWCNYNKRYRAQITKNGKVTNLGNFVDPYQAHLAYQMAAAEHHGEFANFG